MSDIFALPSLNEAFGLSLLEALTVGLPSVVSNVGGIPEVTNDSCSVFVPPGNSHSLAKAVIELFQNKNKLANMRVEAVKQSSKFSLSQMLSKYTSVYNQLIK